MPKHRQKELIQGQYFDWLVGKRGKVYFADGRSNQPKLGRYSLDATDRDTAVSNLKLLDRVKAVEHSKADSSILKDQAGGLSITEGWQLYFASVEGRKAVAGVSSKTIKRYRAVGAKFLLFCAAQSKTQCGQINKSLLDAYAKDLDAKDYAYATLYLELTTLKQFLNYLVDEKHLPASVLFKYPLAKPNETDTYCYHPAEVEAIQTLCASKPDLAWLHRVLATLIHTGMRISEVASLRHADLNFEQNLIVLKDERHSAARRRAGVARELKGKSSRSFPIHPHLLPVLRAVPVSANGFVFQGPLGGKLKPDLVRRALIRDVLTPLASRFPTPPGEAVGFIDGRVHSFRHYFCSLCANSRVPEQTLKRWLGHTSSKMIKRYYHLHDDASQRAMEQVGLTKQ